MAYVDSTLDRPLVRSPLGTSTGKESTQLETDFGLRAAYLRGDAPSIVANEAMFQAFSNKAFTGGWFGYGSSGQLLAAFEDGMILRTGASLGSNGAISGGTDRAFISSVGLEIQGGTKFRSRTATEIGVQTNNTAYTVGSQGSMVAPVVAVAATDALAGDLSGALAVRTDVASLYCRVGATWLSVAVAGFSFPKHSDEPITLGKPGVYDETICPLCWKQMRPGELFGLVGDRFYDDTYGRSLHSYGAHLLCAIRNALSSLSQEERLALVTTR